VFQDEQKVHDPTMRHKFFEEPHQAPQKDLISPQQLQTHSPLLLTGSNISNKKMTLSSVRSKLDYWQQRKTAIGELHNSAEMIFKANADIYLAIDGEPFLLRNLQKIRFTPKLVCLNQEVTKKNSDHKYSIIIVRK